MKKLITIIIAASLALTIQAQDVTTKLGASGSFYINDENDNEIIQIDNAGTFHFKNEVPGSSTQFDLYNAGHNLKLNFYKAHGTPSAPTSVTNFTSLGIIYFQGYTGASYHIGAMINATVSGTPSGSTLPTDLVFSTTLTGNPGLEERMVIKSDGKVGIGTESPNSTLNVNGSLALPLTLAFSSRTLNESEYTIIASGTITLTLPDSNGIEGRIYVIKKTSNNTNVVTIDAGSGHEIDGSQTKQLDKAYQYIIVQASGATNWVIIGGN